MRTIKFQVTSFSFAEGSDSDWMNFDESAFQTELSMSLNWPLPFFFPKCRHTLIKLRYLEFYEYLSHCMKKTTNFQLKLLSSPLKIVFKC